MTEANTSSSPTRAEHSGRSSSGEKQDSRTDMSSQAGRDDANVDRDVVSDPTVGTYRPDEPLDEYEWKELEERFERKMEERQAAESEIYEEFNTLLAAFTSWAQSSSVHEPDRAFKRLKTRMTYVQGAEQSLEEKRQHRIKIVEAFKNALALFAEQ